MLIIVTNAIILQYIPYQKNCTLYIYTMTYVKYISINKCCMNRVLLFYLLWHLPSLDVASAQVKLGASQN